MQMRFTLATFDAEYDFTWEDGKLTGDSILVDAITAELGPNFDMRHPWGYTPRKPYISDPHAVMYAAQQFGTLIRQTGNVPSLTEGHPPDTIY